ncbi:hypothetical protein [Methanococcoides sp. AM1]|uniref:hypothetical protein n=1 Tax=Methanococcoides sp. AM1 TaxID=1201011 RepID=UPI0014383334|nr:hypothetical protein [Methanococcoides sp. AM1]
MASVYVISGDGIFYKDMIGKAKGDMLFQNHPGLFSGHTTLYSKSKVLMIGVI